jgi:hypothetical protein
MGQEHFEAASGAAIQEQTRADTCPRRHGEACHATDPPAREQLVAAEPSRFVSMRIT